MELPATVNEEQGEDHNQGAYTQYLPCQQTCVPGVCRMEGSGSLCDVNSKMSRGGVHGPDWRGILLCNFDEVRGVRGQCVWSEREL